MEVAVVPYIKTVFSFAASVAVSPELGAADLSGHQVGTCRSKLLVLLGSAATSAAGASLEGVRI